MSRDAPDDDADADGDAGDADSGGDTDVDSSAEAACAELARLLAEASDCARERRPEAALDRVDRIERLASRELGDTALASTVEHGCEEVRQLVHDEPLVAAEYLDAMRRDVATD
ncbi:MAG: hypothetical protein ABEJ22_08895 [Haloferacaceae archaeon]